MSYISLNLYPRKTDLENNQLGEITAINVDLEDGPVGVIDCGQIKIDSVPFVTNSKAITNCLSVDVGDLIIENNSISNKSAVGHVNFNSDVLFSGTVNLDNIQATTLNSSTGIINNLYYTTATGPALHSKYLTFDTLTGPTGYITTLFSSSVNSTGVRCASFTGTNCFMGTGTFSNTLLAPSASITSLSSSNISATGCRVHTASGVFVRAGTGIFNSVVSTVNNTTSYVGGAMILSDNIRCPTGIYNRILSDSSTITSMNATDIRCNAFTGVQVNAGTGIFGQIVTNNLLLEGTAQGFLINRVTTAQRNSIVSPLEGSQVYDTDLKSTCTFNGTNWFYPAYIDFVLGTDDTSPSIINWGTITNSSSEIFSYSSGTFTILRSGVYKINGVGIFFGTLAERYVDFVLFRNTSTVVRRSYSAQDASYDSGQTFTCNTINCIVSLNANDTLHFQFLSFAGNTTSMSLQSHGNILRIA